MTLTLKVEWVRGYVMRCSIEASGVKQEKQGYDVYCKQFEIDILPFNCQEIGSNASYNYKTQTTSTIILLTAFRSITFKFLKIR